MYYVCIEKIEKKYLYRLTKNIHIPIKFFPMLNLHWRYKIHLLKKIVFIWNQFYWRNFQFSLTLFKKQTKKHLNPDHELSKEVLTKKRWSNNIRNKNIGSNF